MRIRRTKDWAWIVVLTLLFGLAGSAQAADDTARFNGTWKATFPYNRQTVTMVSVHNANGFANYFVVPTGYSPAGNGTFSAANGRYVTSSPSPNNAGTYRFINNDAVICTNAAGQSLTWRREKTSPPQAQTASADAATTASCPGSHSATYHGRRPQPRLSPRNQCGHHRHQS